jgi:hypothetical protein
VDIFYTNVLNTGPAGPTGPQGPSGTSNVHAAVNAATIQALSGVWSYTVGTTGGDGGNGVGATLTSTTAGIPGIDDVNLTTGMRVLVKDQADLKQNGVYYVTRGAAGQTPIWTRATDYDNSTVGQVAQGDQILVLAGTQNANKVYFETVTGTAAASSIKIGTDNIVFAQSSNLSNVNTDIIPAIDNFYNLGSSSLRWKSINVGPGTIYITDQTLLTQSSLSVDNGVLQVNGANQLQVGQLKFVDNTIESTTGAINIQIGVTSSSASLILNRNTALASGKSLTFGDSTVQTTAFIPGVGQLKFRTTPPAHDHGAAGDKAFDACLDGNHLYICSANYVNDATVIWKRIAYSSGNW